MRIFCLLFIFCLWPGSLQAKESWICKVNESASQRNGNIINSCGIGEGRDENDARLKAFDNAKIEFTKVCEASDICKEHRIDVEPKRTTCEAEARGFKCYRMIAFTILDTKKGIDKLTDKSAPVREDTLGTFSYSEIQKMPKVRVGMTKEELLKSFGAPVSRGQVELPHMGFWGTSAALLTFKGNMCASEYSCSGEAICAGGRCSSGGNGLDKACFSKNECGVAIDEGKVVHIVNFNLKYTEDLK